MISSKSSCRRRNSFYAVAALLLALLAYLVTKVFAVNGLGGARLFCLFYAAVITVFFVAQIVAFLVSHTNYSDDVEKPKFDMIDGEEQGWRSYRVATK